MKSIFYLLTVAFLGTATFSMWSGRVVVDAQTTAANRGRQTVLTPTPTPFVPVLIKPTPKPTETPEEIIKIDTELVNLSVRVIDRNNRPVNGLLQKDFKILENGNEQQIDFFSKSEVPTNYGIVVDNSGSMRQLLDKVIEAGKILVNTNRPDDETMIIRFVGRDKIEIEQQFTANKADLNDALENLYIEGGQTAIIDAVYLAVENIDEYERTQKNDHKRRALILVSDGEDRNSYYNEKQLFELLRESEVQIYVIGFVSELSKDGGFIKQSPQAKSKALLERLATETGGKAYFPANGSALPELAKDISNELRTQYSIGYIPSGDVRDSSYKNIKVTVEDGPNKEKRIAIHRAGRNAEGGGAATAKPSPTPAKP